MPKNSRVRVWSRRGVTASDASGNSSRKPGLPLGKRTFLTRRQHTLVRIDCCCGQNIERIIVRREQQLKAVFELGEVSVHGVFVVVDEAANRLCSLTLRWNRSRLWRTSTHGGESSPISNTFHTVNVVFFACNFFVWLLENHLYSLANVSVRIRDLIHFVALIPLESLAVRQIVDAYCESLVAFVELCVPLFDKA